MIKKSRWLDGAPSAGMRSRNLLTQTDRTDTGVVTEIVDPVNVAVHIDDSVEPDVVAPSAAGVTSLGARARLIRDSAGKVIRVEVPAALPEGADPVYVGATGDKLHHLDLQVIAAGEISEELAGQIEQTKEDLEQTQQELADATTEIETVVKPGIEGAQGAAEDALGQAAGALVAANLADAATKGLIKVSVEDPGHQEGRIWFQLEGTGGGPVTLLTSNFDGMTTEDYCPGTPYTAPPSGTVTTCWLEETYSPTVPIQPGTVTVEFDAWRWEGNIGFTVGLEAVGGWELSTAPTIVTSYGAWSRYRATFTAPSAAAQAVVVFRQDPGWVWGENSWLTTNLTVTGLPPAGAPGAIIGIKISDGTTWETYTQIVGQLLVPGSVGTIQLADSTVTTPKLVVSAEMWAAILSVAGDATIGGRLLVGGAIGARELNVVPEEGQGGARIDGQGIEIIPADSEGVSAIRLRADADTWITFVKDSAATFSVSPDGDLTAQSVYANASLVYRGMELEEILATMPRGVLAHTVLLADMIFSTAWARACFATFEAVAGRRYTARFTGQFDATSTGIKVAVRQSAGSSVSASNSIQQSWSVPASRASYPATVEYSYHFDSNITGTVSIGFFVRTVSGNARALTTGSSIDGTATTMITIEDVGLAPEVATVPGYTTVSGSSSGSNTDTSTSTYVKTVAGSWGRSFKLDGTFIAGSLANKAVQGDSGGSWRMGMVGFPSIIGDLSGATVKKIEIYVYFEHWYYNTGGTAGIGYHGSTAAPETWNGSTAAITKTKIPKPGGVWITLPSSTWASWKSGAYRGITLRALGDSSDRIYYGYANPARCQLRYTYVK